MLIILLILRMASKMWLWLRDHVWRGEKTVVVWPAVAVAAASPAGHSTAPKLHVSAPH